MFAVYSLLGEYHLSLFTFLLKLCIQLLIGFTLPLSVYNIPYKKALCKMEFYFPEKLQAERARERFIDDPTLVYAVTLAALTGDTSHLLAVLRDI